MPIPPLPIFLPHGASSSAAKYFLLRNPTGAAYAATAARAGASSLLAAALGRDLWLRIPEWVREDDVWKSLTSSNDNVEDDEGCGFNGYNDEEMQQQQKYRDEMASLAAVIQKLQALIIVGYEKLGSERRTLRRRRRVAQISKTMSSSALSPPRTTTLLNTPLLSENEAFEIDKYPTKPGSDQFDPNANNTDPNTTSGTCKRREFLFMKSSKSSFENDGCGLCNCGNSLTCQICNSNQNDVTDPSPSSASEDPTNSRISALEWHAALLAYFQLCNQIRERYPSWRDDMYKKCESDNLCDDMEVNDNLRNLGNIDVGKTDANTFLRAFDELKTSHDDNKLANSFIKGGISSKTLQPTYDRSEWAFQYDNLHEVDCNVAIGQETSPENTGMNTSSKKLIKHPSLTSEQIDELRRMLDYAVWAYEPDEKLLRSFLMGDQNDLKTENNSAYDGTAREHKKCHGFQLLVHRTTSYIEPTKDECTDSTSNSTNQPKKGFFSNRKSGTAKILRKPPGRVGYYVAVSHEKRTLLIGIKGTSTLEDLLTDCCGRAVRVDLDNDPHIPSKLADAQLSERCDQGPNNEMMCHGKKSCNLVESGPAVKTTNNGESIGKPQRIENKALESDDAIDGLNNEESAFVAKTDTGDGKQETRVLGVSYAESLSHDSEGKLSCVGSDYNFNDSQRCREDSAIMASVGVGVVIAEAEHDKLPCTGGEPTKDESIKNIYNRNLANFNVFDRPDGENLERERSECNDHYRDTGEACKEAETAEWNSNDASADEKIETKRKKSHHNVLHNATDSGAFDTLKKSEEKCHAKNKCQQETYSNLPTLTNISKTQYDTELHCGITVERVKEKETESLSKVGFSVVENKSNGTRRSHENFTTHTNSWTIQTTEANESSKINDCICEKDGEIAIPHIESIVKNREDIISSARLVDNINCLGMENDCIASTTSASSSRIANAKSLTDNIRVIFSDENGDNDEIEVQFVSLEDKASSGNKIATQHYTEEISSRSSNIFSISTRPASFPASPQKIPPPSDNILILPSNSTAVSFKSQSKSNLKDMACEEIDGIEMEPQRSAKIRGAHEGVLHCAQQLLSEIIPLIEEYAISKGYDVVCTGHSLGAGTASLLAILIRGRYPELTDPEIDCNKKCDIFCAHLSYGFLDSTLFKQRVRAYSFASPPVLDRESSLACRHYVLTVVNNSDIIPRSSLTNLDVLLTVLEAVRSRLVELGMNPSSGGNSKRKGCFSNNVLSSVISLFGKLSEGSKGELLLSIEQLERIRNEAIAEASIGDGERDGLYWNEEGEHHLFAPGHVLMLYEPWSPSRKSSNRTKSNGRDKEDSFEIIDTEKVQELSPNLSHSYRAMWTDGTAPILKYFDIGGGSAIVTDHLTTSYYRALDSVKASKSCDITC